MDKFYKVSKAKNRLGPITRSQGTAGKGQSSAMSAAQESMDTGAQQAAGGQGGGTGGSGGGGQVVSTNPRPIQTGTQTYHFSRTFRHYVMTGNPKYTDVFNQQWSDIPYQYMAMSLKPRDWQTINVTAKRWRVLSVGFNMERIIPFVNETTSTGGTPKANVSFNLLPYMETYIDKGYQLPVHLMYNVSNPLPNANAAQNSTNQANGKLKIINMQNDVNLKPTNSQSTYANFYYAGTRMPPLDLMNSTEWGVADANQTFSFEWTAEGDQLVWRTGLTPSMEIRPSSSNTSYQEANPYGRWDGGFEQNTSQGFNYSNTNLVNVLPQNPIKPMPSCIVRPMTLHDTDGNLTPICFMVLVKYHCTIECDVNDIANYPIFNRPYSEQSTGNQAEYHIYTQDESSTTGRPQYLMWSGASYLGNFRTGPNSIGFTT